MLASPQPEASSSPAPWVLCTFLCPTVTSLPPVMFAWPESQSKLSQCKYHPPWHLLLQHSSRSCSWHNLPGHLPEFGLLGKVEGQLLKILTPWGVDLIQTRRGWLPRKVGGASGLCSNKNKDIVRKGWRVTPTPPPSQGCPPTMQTSVCWFTRSNRKSHSNLPYLDKVLVTSACRFHQQALEGHIRWS
jgi:hypothetical protein